MRLNSEIVTSLATVEEEVGSAMEGRPHVRTTRESVSRMTLRLAGLASSWGGGGGGGEKMT